MLDAEGMPPEKVRNEFPEKTIISATKSGIDKKQFIETHGSLKILCQTNTMKNMAWSYPITFRSRVVRSTAQTQGGGWVGGVHFQKVQFLNYFRHNKSEPDLTDDCILLCF